MTITMLMRYVVFLLEIIFFPFDFCEFPDADPVEK